MLETVNSMISFLLGQAILKIAGGVSNADMSLLMIMEIFCKNKRKINK